MGGNTEKYLSFIIPIEIEVARIEKKNGEEINTKNTSCIVHFIKSTKFMVSLLSNFANNFSERIQRIKCKFGHNEKKKMKLVELNISIVNVSSNIQTLKKIYWNINVWFTIRIH